MIIAGGSIITPTGPRSADVLVEGDRIAAVGAPLAVGDHDVVDARDLWLLPGAVDAHTHFGMPLGPGLTSLGWRESSEAALLGGTTTVIDFANPTRDEHLGQAFERWRGMADGTILCDYGLHVTVTDTAPERLEEIPSLVSRGVATFKGFLAYKGRLMLTVDQMRRLMEAVRKSGAMLLVHAEDGELNEAAESLLVETGRIGPRWHPLAHPEEAEETAVRTVLDLARQTGCPLTIVHMSMAESLELLKEARQAAPGPPAGPSLVGEVCLHHLFRDANLYEGGYKAALAAICSPPLRTREDGEALLGGLADGSLDLLSTDHCEFCLSTKASAALQGFAGVPNGCGGVGERLVLSHTLAVVPGRMSPERWVDVCCRRPAELMGLADRKGRVEVGCDADLVLFDPRPEYRWIPLGASDRAGSLWAGTPVKGRVRDVWLRGRRVVTDGRLEPVQPGGIFLPRHIG